MSTQRANQLVEAGLWLRLSGDHEGARRLFEQALRLDPANARARQLVEATPAPLGVPEPPPVAEASPDSRANPFVRQDDVRGPASIDADWGFAGFWEAPLAAAASQEPPSPTVQLSAPPDSSTAWDSGSNPGLQIVATQPGLGGAMDMLADDSRPVTTPRAPERPSPASTEDEVRTLLRGAKDLLELDDHTGAMDLILKAEELAPEDLEVQELRAHSERVLQAMYESKLGDLAAIPQVALKDDEIIWLNLDHRAGFVLAQIDGTVSFEDLFAVSGMSRLDTARILAQLVDEGVIRR